MKKIWNRIPKFLRNKYAACILVFAVWMLFFDQNDLISQMRFKKELNQLEEDKNYYLREIELTRKDLDELMTNPKKLERFAREKYLMKKEGETVFVIVEEG